MPLTFNPITGEFEDSSLTEEPVYVPVDGKDGEKGEKGDKGERGEKGDKGDSGKDGVDGKDGRDGIDGIDGTSGADGVGLEYEWDGTKLGVKRENESQFQFVDLKGKDGENGAGGGGGTQKALKEVARSYVPYTGATTDVDLGANNITATAATFSTLSVGGQDIESYIIAMAAAL
jgi:hypothetical protein